MVKNPPANAGDVSSVSGLEDSPRGGNSSPLQYLFLENPINRGAWQAIVHSVAESDMTEVTKPAHIDIGCLYHSKLQFLL